MQSNAPKLAKQPKNMIVLFISLFYSIILRRKSPRGLGVGRDRYLLENVLPGNHTEESALRNLDSEGEGLNEKLILNSVSNDKSDGALPVILWQNQKELDSKYSWLGNFVSKASIEEQDNCPINLTFKDRVDLTVYVGFWFKQPQGGSIVTNFMQLAQKAFFLRNKAFYFKEDNLKK